MAEVFLPPPSSTVLKSFLVENGFCGVDAERRTSCGPLHVAVQQGNASMVRLLLEAGADPNWADSHGQTPRQLAARLNKHGTHDEILVLFGGHSVVGGARPASGATGSADVASTGRSHPGTRVPTGPAEPSQASCVNMELTKESARTGEALPVHLSSGSSRPPLALSTAPVHATAASCRTNSPMKVRLPQERALPTLLQAEMRRHKFEDKFEGHSAASASEPRKREGDPAQVQAAVQTSAMSAGPFEPNVQQHRRQSHQEFGGGRGSAKGPADSVGAAASNSLVLLASNKPSRSVQSQLIMLAQDQRGSRLLQAQLQEAEQQDRAKIFEGLLLVASRLACDLHGHAVVMQLFGMGTPEQRRALALRLRGSVLRLSKDRYGCWVIQKALETVPRDAQIQLANEFETHACECVENMHGNFVIQKCIEQVPQESVPFIAREIEARVESIAAHMYGCRAVQRLFEHCSPNQLRGIKEQIIRCTARLAKDTYGNNVVRHLLDHGSEDDKRRIIEVIRSDVLEFAKNKSSSLVLEKCLEIVTSGEHARSLEEERAALMHELLEGRGGANPPVQQIMLDRFGNYIVQRLIERCRGAEREVLRRRLLAAEPRLRRSSNGKHILAVMQREFGQL